MITAEEALALVLLIPESPDGLPSPEEGRVREALLREHPGHASQSSHGRRGVHKAGHADLNSPLVPGSLERLKDGGMYPSWSGRLQNGTKVFVKRPALSEFRNELAAESLNVLGFEGDDSDYGLVRMPHAEVTRMQIPNRMDGTESEQSVVVTEWVDGEQYARGYGRAMQADVDDTIVFDFVAANGDRHAGNAMVTPTGHVWSVDHGQMFGSPSHTALGRTTSDGRVPLTPKHRKWLTKIAEMPQDEITAVMNSGVKAVPGANPFHAGFGRSVKARAQDLLEFGQVPTGEDIGTFIQSGWLPPLTEARLEEHPGHDNQKVHGRRGPSVGLAAMRPARWRDVGSITAGGRTRSRAEALEDFGMNGYTGEGQGPAIEAKIEAAEGLASEMLADDARLKAMCSDPPPKQWLDRETYGGYYASADPMVDFVFAGSNFGAQHALPGSVTASGPGPAADAAELLMRARRDESTRVQDLAMQWSKMSPAQREQLLRTDESFRYSLCSGYIKQWQMTAADSDAVALAIQHAASKEFGLADLPSAQHLGSGRAPTVLRHAGETFEDHGQLLTGMVRVTYARTQYELAFRGITSVTIARGINSDSFEQAVYKAAPAYARETVPSRVDSRPGMITGVAGVKVSGHPLQSWSLDPVTALNFGMQTMAVEVSAKRIFSWPRTGQGCLSEAELVMLGGNDDSVWGGNWEERGLAYVLDEE